MKKIIITCFFASLFYSCGKPDGDGACKDSVSYPYWSEWTDDVLVSIVNDSLAAVATFKYKTDCGRFLYEEITHYRPGLFLVNYRAKQKPLLGDTLVSEYKVLDHHDMRLDLIILGGYLFRDSSALVFDLKNNKFGFWKIGENSIKFSGRNKPSDFTFARNAGHWKNGSIVFYDWSGLNILDTEKGQIESFGYMPEHECMRRYIFLSYVGDKVVCANYIYADSDGTIENYNLLLLVDGILADSIVFSSGGANPSYMFGNYVALQDKVFKIDTLNLKFDRDFSLWFDKNPLRFYNDKINNPDDFVSYSEEDLIGVIK